MPCPSCGSQNPAGHHFCGSCGRPLVSVSQMATSPVAPAVAVGIGRLVSSDTIAVGGLAPGAILSGRYRIIGLLGRGGMGEVYRADDLKLGQPVALKFLPRGVSGDPVRRERFFAEVRITRQLAHPNICRVYDIGETSGAKGGPTYFLSMELIDGEDLASLLKRIGHLSREKTLDIARQLAAGLSAAHERGVLHRDLKPANIMIDGRGRVRITDFGLAVTTADEPVEGDMSGTPAYMAPEQLAGKAASVRTDLYALGLVLYEILTGKKAFTAATIAELRHDKEQSTPAAPSDLRAGIDPAVERLVMRCLERDPRARPASVAQLAAALPGGDPLAAALAAGETPSPELVAASGEREGLRPTVAMGILALVTVLVVAAVAMKARVDFYRQIPFDKPPAALVEQCRQFLKKLGYGSLADDSAWGFTTDPAYVAWLERTNKSADRWRRSGSGAVVFWYRQSPGSLAPTRLPLATEIADPPLDTPGEVVIVLDTEGHLLGFNAVPAQAGPVAEAATPNWSIPFSEAGLDTAHWIAAAPERDPLFHADVLAAWTGSTTTHPGVPRRVEAAARRGKIVSFVVTGPWEQPTRLRFTPLSVSAQILVVSEQVLTVAVIGVAAFFARRNLRLGRGDRKGAMRLALASASLLSIVWIVNAHHVAAPQEGALLVSFLAYALLASALLWLFYIALEPFARRHAPHTLVSWTRVVAGEWRDPRIGTDVLAGLVFGLCLYFVVMLQSLVPSWIGSPESLDIGAPDGVLGAGNFISAAIARLAIATALSLWPFFMWFLVRIHRLVGGALALLLLGVLAPTEAIQPSGAVGNVWIAELVFLLGMAMTVFVLLRFGLFTCIVGYYVESMVRHFPITFHASAWYASTGYAALVLLGAITVYGFRTSLGGRPLLPAGSLDG